MKRASIVSAILFLIPLCADAQVIPQPPIDEQRLQITPAQLEKIKEYQIKEDQTFDSLRRELDSLQNRVQTTDTDIPTLQLSKDDKAKVRESLERSEVNLKYLQFKSKTEDVPEEYLETLNAAAEQLRTLRASSSLGKEGFERLKDLEADLEVKATSAQQCKTEPFMKYGVTAKTKKGSAEVGGFEVWYVPKGDPDNTGKYTCLRGCAHSSPVDGEAVAGIYYFWAQNPQNSQNKGERRKHTVECGGEKELTLPTP